MTPAASAPDARPRILVVASPYVGDTVLAVPFLRNLRRAFPGHGIDLLAEGRPPGELLHGCPHVDAVLPWERPRKRPRPDAPMEMRGRGAWRALVNAVAYGAALRGRRYAAAYLLKRSPSTALLSLCAGIPRRVGHARPLVTPLLTHAVPLEPGRHRVDAWLDLLASAGHGVDDGRLEAWPAPEALARVDELLAALPADRPRVFVAVTASDWRRQWPLARWAEVIRRLVAERGCEIVLCGGPADVAMHRELAALVQPGVARHLHDLSERVSLRQATALLYRMDLCVGIDSGLPHLAASHGLPVAVLFGPTDPNQWHPRGERAAVVRAERLSPTRVPQPGEPPRWPIGNASMADIAVADVLAACDRLLPVQVAQPAVRTIDLRPGGHVRAVWAGRIAAGVPVPDAPPSGDRAAARFQPAVMAP